MQLLLWKSVFLIVQEMNRKVGENFFNQEKPFYRMFLVTKLTVCFLQVELIILRIFFHFMNKKSNDGLMPNWV